MVGEPYVTLCYDAEVFGINHVNSFQQNGRRRPVRSLQWLRKLIVTTRGGQYSSQFYFAAK
jgi:hypothetical protein